MPKCAQGSKKTGVGVILMILEELSSSPDLVELKKVQVPFCWVDGLNSSGDPIGVLSLNSSTLYVS